MRLWRILSFTVASRALPAPATLLICSRLAHAGRCSVMHWPCWQTNRSILRSYLRGSRQLQRPEPPGTGCSRRCCRAVTIEFTALLIRRRALAGPVGLPVKNSSKDGRVFMNFGRLPIAFQIIDASRARAAHFLISCAPRFGACAHSSINSLWLNFLLLICPANYLTRAAGQANSSSFAFLKYPFAGSSLSAATCP